MGEMAIAEDTIVSFFGKLIELKLKQYFSEQYTDSCGCGEFLEKC